MAFVGETPELAIAVCGAGGIGALSGFAPPDRLRASIRAVKAATDATFHVNLLGVLPNDDQIEVCIGERVPVVSFHWGHPPPAQLAALREAGTAVREQVGTADAARAVERLGSLAAAGTDRS
jgi:NAD(P)H-dependent flavin oxidoreductase YrpB (nitropropane dioxygenase family)